MRSGYANASSTPAEEMPLPPLAPPICRSRSPVTRRTLCKLPASTPPPSPPLRITSTRVVTSASRDPGAPRITSLSDSNAANSVASGRQSISRARISMCARRGCTPIVAISLPCEVIRPSRSSAPRCANRSRALARVAAGGESNHRIPPASRTPQLASSSAKGTRSASRISGGENCASVRCEPSLHAR